MKFHTVFLPVLVFCLAGNGLTVLNKILVSKYFPFPSFLTFIQCLFTAISIRLGKNVLPNIFVVEDLNLKKCISWSPLVVLFLLMLISSMLALQKVTVTSLIVVRNLTTLTTAICDIHFLKSQFSKLQVMLLLLMFSGACLYGLNDISFNFNGYLYLLLNCIATTAYQIKVKVLVSELKMGALTMAYYNNLLSLPLLLPLSAIQGEFSFNLLATIRRNDSLFLILLSSFFGFALSITAFRLNQLVSATAIMIINNANKFLLIAYSEAVLGKSLDLLSGIGCAIVLASSFAYSRSNRVLDEVARELKMTTNRSERENKEDKGGASDVEADGSSSSLVGKISSSDRDVVQNSSVRVIKKIGPALYCFSTLFLILYFHRERESVTTTNLLFRSENEIKVPQVLFSENARNIYDYFASRHKILNALGNNPQTECESIELGSLEALEVWSLDVQNKSDVLQLARKVAPRIFIAGVVKQNCNIMYRYILELIKLVFLYRDNDFLNTYISIGESSSSDCTNELLHLFRILLDEIGVPNSINILKFPKRIPEMHRIDFLQRIRNKVLEPMLVSDINYDEVVFLSDTLFCASDIVRLLTHHEANMKCGLDIAGKSGMFYDTWVAHDIAGNNFFNQYPFTSHSESSERVKNRKPFQVMCCWNGLTILNAAAFTIDGLRFRRSLTSDECHAAETELICNDFRAIGRPNILVDPVVTVSYDIDSYVTLGKGTNQIKMGRTNLSNSFYNGQAETLHKWVPEPRKLNCFSLDGHPGNDPDRSKGSAFDWYSYYQKWGVPVAIERKYANFHDCQSTFAESCNLTRGKRIPHRIKRFSENIGK